MIMNKNNYRMRIIKLIIIMIRKIYYKEQNLIMNLNKIIVRVVIKKKRFQ